MTNKKKRIIILSVIAFIIVALVTGVFLLLFNTVSQIDGMTFGNINIESIPDGKYIGENSSGIISVKAEVTVKEGRITDIEILRHANGMGGDAEKITERMINEQKTDVDTVSGATMSSKVIKKAVENALLNFTK